LLVAMLVGSAAPAAAQEQIESAYSDLNLDECTVLNADDFGASWACPGYKGFPVWVAEGDLRFFVSYGFGAEDEKAAGQTPPPFNYLGPKVEWRLSKQTGDWRPFATIVRYYTSLGEGEKEGQVLVVTKLEDGATCHVAYIDALANRNANAMAREAADASARDFDCADDPEIIGPFDAWEN
jgi:hypothetical protein